MHFMSRYCLLEALTVQLMSMQLSKVVALNGQSFLGVIIDGPYKALHPTRSSTPLLLQMTIILSVHIYILLPAQLSVSCLPEVWIVVCYIVCHYWSVFHRWASAPCCLVYYIVDHFWIKLTRWVGLCCCGWLYNKM